MLLLGGLQGGFAESSLDGRGDNEGKHGLPWLLGDLQGLADSRAMRDEVHGAGAPLSPGGGVSGGRKLDHSCTGLVAEVLPELQERPPVLVPIQRHDPAAPDQREEGKRGGRGDAGGSSQQSALSSWGGRESQGSRGGEERGKGERERERERERQRERERERQRGERGERERERERERDRDRDRDRGRQRERERERDRDRDRDRGRQRQRHRDTERACPWERGNQVEEEEEGGERERREGRGGEGGRGISPAGPQQDRRGRWCW